jgi:hypothetical protein
MASMKILLPRDLKKFRNKGNQNQKIRKKKRILRIVSLL